MLKRRKYQNIYKTQKKFPYKIFILGVVGCLTVGTFIVLNITRIQLMMKGYGFTAQNMILQLDEKDIEDYLSLSKIEHLEDWDHYSNHHHYLQYHIYQQEHTNLQKEDVISYIDLLYEKYRDDLKKLHYSDEQIMNLTKYAKIDDFSTILTHAYTYQDIEPYLDINGMIFDDLPKYIASSKDPLQAVLSISYSFIDSHYKNQDTYEIEDPTNFGVLIKKGFILPSDYEPSDLVQPHIPIAPDNTHNLLRKEAAQALEKMYDDALKEGYHLVLNSGYRSFQQQKDIYDEYFQKYDEVTARGLVAVPGSSEHQLGLGIDLTSQSVLDGERMVFGDTSEYQWVIKNAHRYGFILRYPKDRSDITGTANEPWHIRYVGKDMAALIYKNNWVLEDYILKNGFTYHLKKVK